MAGSGEAEPEGAGWGTEGLGLVGEPDSEGVAGQEGRGSGAAGLVQEGTAALAGEVWVGLEGEGSDWAARGWVAAATGEQARAGAGLEEGVGGCYSPILCNHRCSCTRNSQAAAGAAEAVPQGEAREAGARALVVVVQAEAVRGEEAQGVGGSVLEAVGWEVASGWAVQAREAVGSEREAVEGEETEGMGTAEGWKGLAGAETVVGATVDRGWEGKGEVQTQEKAEGPAGARVAVTEGAGPGWVAGVRA